MNKAQEKLYSMIYEFPNDYVVIAVNPGMDYFISDAYTYLESAKKEHNRYINTLDINFKVGIYQLNKNSLKNILEV